MAGVDVQGAKDRVVQVLKGFSASQLAILGVLGVVAVVGAFAFLRWVNTPTYQVLLAGLDAKDASAVTAQLDTNGVAYKLESGGSTVLVPSAKLDAERLAVAAAGLPAAKTDSGWAVFDKQGMTSSSFQQQVAYQRAMEGTLGTTLTGIDGVDSATVHLALPEKKLFTEVQQPARASVLLTTRKTLDSGAVDAVTRLVASSVPGLAPEDVSVSDAKGNLLNAKDGGTAGNEAQAAMEDQLSLRATSMLDTLLGAGRAVVRVTAELDTASTSTDSEVYDNTKTAVTKESTSLETYAAPPAGTTNGVVTAPTTPATTGTGNNSDYRKEANNRDIGVSRTVTSVKAGPGGVKRLTVAVAVDSSVPNAPTQAELRDLVSNAVGLDATRGDTIAVTTPAFVQAPADPTAGAPAGGAMTNAMAVAPSVLGGLLLLLVALGFLRTLKRGSSSEVPADEVSAALASAGGPAALQAGAAHLELGAGSAAEARQEGEGLVELVDEHPDEVTNLLRGWLANTGPSGVR